MTRSLFRATIPLLASLALSTASNAQPRGNRARAATMAPSRDLPRYTSLEAFLSARTSGSFLGRGGVPTGSGSALPLATGRRTPRTGAGRIEVVRAPNGTVAWMRGNLGRLEAGKASSARAVSEAALRALAPFAPILLLADPASELALDRVESDALGFTHVRFRQAVDGIPVWARELVAHVDPSGRIHVVNGSYEPTANRRVSREAFGPDEAIRRTERLLRAEGRWNPPPDELRRQLGIDPPTAEPVYHPARDGSLVRAWRVLAHPNTVQWYEIVLDAGSGEVLEKIPRHCTLLPDDRLGSTSAPVRIDAAGIGTGAGPGSGTFVSATAADLNGTVRSLRVYREDSGQHYAIWDLPNITAFTLPDIPSVGGAITLTAGNQDDFTQAQHVLSSDNHWSDPSMVSAHVNMEAAYSYYTDTHARRAINDRDESMISVVHITQDGASMENAFWTGRIMGYGDGGTVFKPLAGALDVAAHEMSHGVIEHSANLVYQYQPGALNESMADVFAAFVDRDDLLMGEDIMMPGFGAALRDLRDPASPSLLPDFRQPTHMSEYQDLGGDTDGGGVHVNSGIPNRAAALIIVALGHARAERIYYRALTSYLTRSSQFGDARRALEQSAIDLFGASGTEATAVAQAFDAVGIGTDTSGPGGSEGNEVEPATGAEYVFFLLDDGSIAFLDMATLEAFVLDTSTGAVSNGVTQLSVPRDGKSVWYIHDSGRLARFDLDAGTNFVFDGIFAREPGDLWNVAIAPDESVAVFASAYERDPNLYVTDGEQTVIIELKAQTTQDGILDESIVAPDVISISPNPDVARLTFDALREVEASGDLLQFWSIFEMDFESGRIYNLIPAQPEGYSVGNITYGKTDPDLVAFNVIDHASNEWQVWVAGLSSGDTYRIDTSGMADAERPSFSPDDTGLVFTTTDTDELIFYDAATDELTSIGFGIPIHNPVWFARGSGSTAAERAGKPSTFRLDSVFPNPFSGVTSIRVSVDRPGPVTVSVYDVLGREVERLYSGVLAPGEHVYRWSARGRANGAYFIRVDGAGKSDGRPAILAR